MRKVIIVSIFGILLYVCGLRIYFLKDNINVSLDNKQLIIIAGDGTRHEELLYTHNIQEVSLISYKSIKINKDTIISISMDYTEAEERGEFENLLIFLYRDLQFTCILDSYRDYPFQKESYSFTSLGGRNFNISLPNQGFDITLKNNLSFEDSELNESFEKDLINRIEHKDIIGYPTLSQGLHNINISNSESSIKFSFSKFVYGFFHADIIGEIHYIYEYSSKSGLISEHINFEPSEEYDFIELVN